MEKVGVRNSLAVFQQTDVMGTQVVFLHKAENKE
jgi:hypothetical protein